MSAPRTQLCTQHLLGCKPETVTPQVPIPEVPGRGPRVVWGNAHWCHHREGLEWGSRIQWSFMGQTGRKICRKMSKSTLARAPQLPHEVSPGKDSGASLMPSSPCPALLLRGRHGPALHTASLTAPGQTERQPAAHLPALPHQALTPQHMCSLTSGPIVCPFGLSPSPLPVFHTPPPDSPSFVPVPPGPWEGWPRDRKCPQVPTPSSPKAWHCYSTPPPLGSRGQAGPRSRPPGMASQAALNEALLGEAEPHRRVWAVLL